MSKEVNLRLPKWAFSRIKQIADETGITIDEAVNQILAFELNRIKSSNEFDDHEYWRYIINEFRIIELIELGTSIGALIVHLNERGINCTKNKLINELRYLGILD